MVLRIRILSKLYNKLIEDKKFVKLKIYRQVGRGSEEIKFILPIGF